MTMPAVIRSAATIHVVGRVKPVVEIHVVPLERSAVTVTVLIPAQTARHVVAPAIAVQQARERNAVRATAWTLPAHRWAGNVAAMYAVKPIKNVAQENASPSVLTSKNVVKENASKNVQIVKSAVVRRVSRNVEGKITVV